jgi:ParB family transcriptional regulator, chromosome partitioning protein
MGKVEELQKRFAGTIADVVGASRPDAVPANQPSRTDKYGGMQKCRDFAEMPLERIFCEKQPRESFDDESITELAESIKKHGQLAPIRVQWVEERQAWKVLVGERRFRSCQRAGLTTIRCQLIERPITQGEILAEQVVENLHRAGLSAIEEAKAFQSLMQLHNFGVNALAEHLRISKSKVSKTLSLLNLPEDIQKQVNAGDIAFSSAYEVTKVGDADEQRDLVDRVRKDKFTQKDAARHVSKNKPVSAHPKNLVEKYRSENGIAVEVTLRRKHGTADIIAALLEIAARLEKQSSSAPSAA